MSQKLEENTLQLLKAHFEKCEAGFEDTDLTDCLEIGEVRWLISRAQQLEKIKKANQRISSWDNFGIEVHNILENK